MAIRQRGKNGWFVFVLLILFSFTLTGRANQGQPVGVDADDAMTVKAILTLKEPEQEMLIELVGLSSVPDLPPTLFSLVWQLEESSWLPVWRLALTSEQNLLLDKTGSESLRLASVEPQPGHLYEAALSYNAISGVIDVSLYDLTEGRLLYQGGRRVASYNGSMYAYIPEGVTEQSVVPWYEPLGVKWDIGTLWHGAYTPMELLEPAGQNRVRIVTQGALPGEFRLLAGEGAEGVVVGRSQVGDGENLVTITSDQLPVGQIFLTLQYIEEGQVRFSEARPIRVGKINVTVGRIMLSHDHAQLESSLILKSDSPLPSMNLQLQATLSKLMWDEGRRQYSQVPYGSFLVEKCDIQNTVAGITLPLVFPGPEEEGIWRMDINLATEPSVAFDLEETSLYFSTYIPAAVQPGEPHIIAVLPDTQLYAKNYPEIYLRQAEWLAANAAQMNIAFALHLGDITNDNEPRQWQAARNAHSLINGVVPYVLTLGNHDYAQGGAVSDRNISLVREYFSSADFPYLGGTMLPDRFDNTYHIFHVAGVDYLVISLEFAPSNEALAWANEVVASYPQHRVIVVTHAYLYPSGLRLKPGDSAKTFPLGQNPSTTMNDGEEIWAKFASQHANIVLVLSGHISSSAITRRLSRGTLGNKVLEILADYQSEPNGGNGYLVLMEFVPDHRLTVRSFSPYLGVDKDDVDRYGYDNYFVIDLSHN